MKERVSLPIDAILPSHREVLREQGIPDDQDTGRWESMVRECIDLLGATARPVGMFASIATDTFARVYGGEGHNDPVTPLAEIHPRAQQLALFAVTLGADVVQRIRRLFQARELVLGSSLDAAASLATERAADALERVFLECLMTELANAEPGPVSSAANAAPPALAVLRYSPGYCGWHVSGQRALFEYLAPEEIGITLRESCLMEPLKSISGILVAGPPQIHVFDDDYPFCDACAAHECRMRIGHLLQTHRGS